MEVTEEEGALTYEEQRALWMPRKHVEVWLETSNFKRIMLSTLLRCVQKINGNRTFFVAQVVGVKSVPRPYKIGKRMVDVALQVRTSTGPRLVGIDTLSNETPSDAELTRFKVPLVPTDVRKKLQSIQIAMQDNSALFEEDDLRRKVEEDERLRQKREEAAYAEEMEREERERKEREREDLRRRQAERTQTETDQWWLQYQQKGDSKQREVAKWKARLARFQKIVNSSGAQGERDNAQRLAEQAELKLQQLEEQDEEQDE